MPKARPSNRLKNVRVEEKQTQQFNENYFAACREDPKRLQMYGSEKARIEARVSSGRILDVGCGIGKFLNQFDPNKWNRYGIDISPIAIDESRLRGIQVKDYENAFDYPNDFFDVIVFRGSIQMMPDPFSAIRKSMQLLRRGGYLVFLATPNSNCPYYRRFKTLPFLDEDMDFLVPSDVMFKNMLKNLGAPVEAIHYPYWSGPYAQPLRDHIKYALSFLGYKSRFAFWKSMMEVYAQKPQNL